MITILCSGSRGDIQPYIALAQQIKKLGVDVRIAAGKSFESFVTGYGISFFSISADLENTDIDQKILKDAKSSDNPLKMLLSFNKLKKYAVLMTDEMYHACENSELIVYHPGCTIGYFTAQKFGIPSVLACPFPLHKTRETASVIAYGRYPLQNKFTYSLLQTMLWMASKPGVAALWKGKFHCLPNHFSAPYERADEQHPAIVSCSNHVFSRPTDWNQHIHQHGYWFVEDNTRLNHSALQEFLEGSEKPIYFGFGSVFQEGEKESFLKLIVEAIRISGKRAIISGFGEVSNLPKSILAIGSISHTWLFPRCAAVCHHGGAGTSAAGFAAGVPSIIVPFSNDQFAWAHRAHDLGVGTKPLPKKKLTALLLAKSIDEAMQIQIVSTAKILAEKIAAENGAKECAKVVIDCLKQ